MSVVTSDVIRATARLQWNDSVDVQNTFTCRYQGASTLDDSDAKADLAEYIDDVYTEINSVLPSSLDYVDIDFFNITQDAPMGVDFWPTLTVGGSATAEVVATGVSYVMTGFTNIVRAHGRKFFGPPAAGAIEGGVFTSPVMVALASAMAVWISPFNGGTSGQPWVPGIWSRAVSLFRAFRDVVTRNIPGYQRRRKQGVGS
jgi:hypothetical protein